MKKTLAARCCRYVLALFVRGVSFVRSCSTFRIISLDKKGCVMSNISSEIMTLAGEWVVCACVCEYVFVVNMCAYEMM